MHLATSLRAAALPASAATAAPPAGSVALPPATAQAADVLVVIATRRSVRRFAPTPLSQGALAGVLAAMTSQENVAPPLP